ncbi:MAG: polysaccharide deacetylase family protein [Bacteroidia bacterium]
MLNHRFVTALFAVAIGAVCICCPLGSTGFYAGLSAALFVYLSIEFFGAYFIGLNFHLDSVNYLDKGRQQIALTFDDGPCEPQTTQVLDTLKRHGVTATFFVIGKNISGNEAILKRMQEEGHSIGSHSFSHHFWIDLWGKQKLKNDILKSLIAIIEATGKETRIMRPPYGVTTPNFRKVMKQLGLQSVGWNVRSYDTTTTDIQKITERVLSETKNGSIVLLHDRLDYMPGLLDRLIPALKEKKFEFVNIPQ